LNPLFSSALRGPLFRNLRCFKAFPFFSPLGTFPREVFLGRYHRFRVPPPTTSFFLDSRPSGRPLVQTPAFAGGGSPLLGILSLQILLEIFFLFDDFTFSPALAISLWGLTGPLAEKSPFNFFFGAISGLFLHAVSRPSLLSSFSSTFFVFRSYLEAA